MYLNVVIGAAFSDLINKCLHPFVRHVHACVSYLPEIRPSTSFQLSGKVFRPVHPEGEVDGQRASDGPELGALSKGGSF